MSAKAGEQRGDAGDTASELNVIDSWVHAVRELFDAMPADGEEAAVSITRRMAAVPAAYRQLARTLLDAARHGRPPARRQAEEVAKQCASWSDPADSFYAGASFSLKDFHTQALSLGAMGLEPLREALARS